MLWVVSGGVRGFAKSWRSGSTERQAVFDCAKAWKLLKAIGKSNRLVREGSGRYLERIEEITESNQRKRRDPAEYFKRGYAGGVEKEGEERGTTREEGKGRVSASRSVRWCGGAVC